MAKIPTLTRRITPSARVAGVPTPLDLISGITPPSTTADFGQGIEARGLAALGKGIGNLGEAIAQIETAEGVSQASTAKGQIDAAAKVFGEELKSNNDPSTYKEELGIFLSSLPDFRPPNAVGAKLFDNLLEQLTPAFEAGVEIARIRKIEDLMAGAYIGDRNKALANGDIDEANRLTIEAKDVTGVITNKQAAKDLQENEEIVKEVLKENAKQFQMNLAVAQPDAVKTAVGFELKARKEGKKPAEPFSLLSNTDLESIRDYANSIGEKKKTDSELASDIVLESNYGKIVDGDVDINSMITDIQADPNISEEDSIKATDKVVTFFSKWNSAKSAGISDESVYDELTQATEAVERGAMSPAAFEELFIATDKDGNTNKSKLSKDDQRAIRSRDIVATKTMQNRTFSDALLATRPTLVELTESDLGALKLARQNAEVIKDLPGVNFFNIAIKKNQAERWNFGRFRKELRSQIAQNPEWSQKQIFVAQETLVEQLDLPVGELLKAFDAQNPNSAILSEPPDISFKEIWQNLSLDDRALIWSERMAGTPTSVLLGSEQVLEAKK